jgi:hypothetical protein
VKTQISCHLFFVLANSYIQTRCTECKHQKIKHSVHNHELIHNVSRLAARHFSQFPHVKNYDTESLVTEYKKSFKFVQYTLLGWLQEADWRMWVKWDIQRWIMLKLEKWVWANTSFVLQWGTYKCRNYTVFSSWTAISWLQLSIGELLTHSLHGAEAFLRS